MTIDGNLNYIGNFVPLFVEGPFNVHVKGNFTYSGNTVPWAGSQYLVVDTRAASPNPYQTRVRL